MLTQNRAAPDVEDTIVASATAAGPGLRAVVRLSGRRAFEIATSLCEELTRTTRRVQATKLGLEGVSAPLPADVYFFAGPRSYTGQDVVEIHTFSSPPLIESLVAACLRAGARAARPGEFTLRAFLAGKLDLTRAEAVHAVVGAGGRDELTQALAQLAGGVAQPLRELREDLLNLLADVEAALDFADEDLQFVRQDELLGRVAKGLALVTNVRRQLEQRGLTRRPFRVVLAGPPNAGKSSLFNALLGRPAALVSPEAGTTRDYLEQTLDLGGLTVQLVDTAGLRDAGDTIEADARALGRREVEDADLVLLCVNGSAPVDLDALALAALPRERLLPVATKSDLGGAPPGLLKTSAATGAGVADLREALRVRARSRVGPALAPSLSRCRHHVEACLDHLRRAHALVLHEEPAELLALELRLAVDELGAVVGSAYTDDLLDRIFSRFCIGK